MRRLTALAWLVAALALIRPAYADHARFGPVVVIDPEHAREMLEHGGVVPIDLRAPSAFDAGRLPGARSLPLSTLASKVDALPAGGALLVYGEGPNERLFGAYHLIRARRAGDVYLLDGGVDAWRRLGYRLER